MGVDTMEEPEMKHFSVPVDSEHKSKVLRLYSAAFPHHRAFHISWLCFFTSFLSTFAAAPLITIIRQDLNLTKSSASGAAVAAVTGTIFARLAMGTFTDTFGPRYGNAMLLSLSSTAVFCMSMVTNSAGFIVVRCLIGFALATFVCCQFWMSSMFAVNVVGTANAFAAGWGNLGGGATQIIMPYLYEGILKQGQPSFSAWRWAYFFPGGMHVLCAVLVLFYAIDLPDGTFADLKSTGQKLQSKGYAELLVGVKNYRTWVLLITYGYCFGVELTIDNNIAAYFSDHFGKSIVAAGNLAAIFGFCNFISRPVGGILSDMAGKRFGMRGRLWWLWTCQTIGGLTCVGLGLSSANFTATIIILVFFSLFLQGACGATFGVVPFVSKRALGLVCGWVGAGGSAGAAVTQAIFFTPAHLTTPEALKWLGVMIIGMTALQSLLYFPMWGGMFFKAKEGATEEDYYFAEWSEAEKEAGDHRSVMNFAAESKSQRGMARLKAEVESNAKVVVAV